MIIFSVKILFSKVFEVFSLSKKRFDCNFELFNKTSTCVCDLLPFDWGLPLNSISRLNLLITVRNSNLEKKISKNWIINNINFNKESCDRRLNRLIWIFLFIICKYWEVEVYVNDPKLISGQKIIQSTRICYFISDHRFWLLEFVTLWNLW